MTGRTEQINVPGRTRLWDLRDYRVSSVSGGVIWLVPRENPRRPQPGGPRDATAWRAQRRGQRGRS
jgi:hypothetical protein